MRLWSLHPKYLDSKGLGAVWREGLLAQKVLLGETKGYKNHPQLIRFKKAQDGLPFTFERHIKILIGSYLTSIYFEAKKRKYNFDKNKIIDFGEKLTPKLTVTKGQLKYEFRHLMNKLEERNKKKYNELLINICQNDIGFFENEGYELIKPHPLFKVVKGGIAEWEKQE